MLTGPTEGSCSLELVQRLTNTSLSLSLSLNTSHNTVRDVKRMQNKLLHHPPWLLWLVVLETHWKTKWKKKTLSQLWHAALVTEILQQDYYAITNCSGEHASLSQNSHTRENHWYLTLYTNSQTPTYTHANKWKSVQLWWAVNDSYRDWGNIKDFTRHIPPPSFILSMFSHLVFNNGSDFSWEF